MKLPSIIPPADLLKQIEGIESGLLQRKRLGKIGVAAAALQIVVLVANNEWWQKLIAFDWRPLDTQGWIFLSILTGSAVFFLLIGWSNFWLKESEEPFRYTYSIAEFAPVEATQKDARMSLLSHDLSERLSERIGRLSLLSEEDLKKDPKDGGGEARPRSHIHIRGYYVVRERSKQQCFIEVMPRVRIGPPGSPETLAHAVKFKLKSDDTKKDGEVFSSVKVEDYEKVLERVYFSVATEIYKQIKQDVQRKIALLPTIYYRAAALFHEAEDYARSNTLDAYDEALKLYDTAMKLYDPTWKPLSKSGWRRPFQQIQRWRARLWTHERGLEARLWPRLGHVEVMCARAEIGYANMLLYRRVLAGISGLRINPVYEARRVAERAVARLRVLPDDVPEKPERLFDAYVTLALAWCFLASFREGKKWLKCARQLHPRRTEEDARYLFAAGELERQMRSRLQRFRLAVEVDPRFEVAQFSLALELERLWRTRPSLERNVAVLVFKEYEEILKLNPGNIGAWANLGYMRWLLGTKDDLQQAKDAYESGREYKEIKRETFVAELDYGLARIAAERGDFEEAYKYYVSAVSAHLAKGVSHEQEFAGYMFEFINDAIRGRFEEYKKTVEKNLVEKKDAPEPTERVLRSVHAFVLNEYGEVCYYYYLQSADGARLREATSAYEEARQCNAYYVMPHFNLAKVSGYEEVEKMLAEVERLEPEWPEGILMMTTHRAGAALEKHRLAREEEAEAEKKTQDAKVYRNKAKEMKAPYGATRSTSDIPQRGEGGSLLRLRMEGTQDRDWKVEEERSQIRRQADELEKQAGVIDKEAEKHQDRANDLMNQAVEVENKALEGLKRLLPHEWAEGALKDLTGKNIPTMISNKHIIWAKELEDIHVRALFTLGKTLSWRARERNRSGNGEVLPQVVKLLQHIREHFWPDHFELHLILRDLLMDEVSEKIGLERLDGELPDSLKVKYRYDDDNGLLAVKGIMFDREREELLKLSSNETFRSAVESLFRKSRGVDEVNRCNEALRAVIMGWIDTDPGAFWALSRVSHETFDIDESKSKFTDALKQPNLSKYFVKWIGDELHKIGAKVEALEAYKDAMQENDPRLLFDLATSLEDKNLWDEALQTYRRARERDWGQAYSEETYLRRIGRTLWALNQYEAAFGEFDAIGKEREDGWRKDVVSNVLPYIDSIQSYRVMKSWLEREQAKCKQAKKGIRDADEALLLVVREKYQEMTREPAVGWGGLSAGMLPVVTPIVIEAYDKLFPEGEGWTGSHELFVKYIPEMRARIEAGMGIKAPGVRVRGNDTDLPLNSYLIMLNEVPLVMGTVDPTRKFCPSCAALCKILEKPLTSGEQVYNPVTGEKDGAWVEQSEWKKAGTAGVPLWDSFEYMTRHLESVLRDNLTTFVGFQEIHNLLDDWCRDKDAGPQRQALVNQALPDLNRRVRFVQVLQGLLREYVPITKLRDILEAFRRHDAAEQDVFRVVEAVRLVLKNDLPGNRGSYQVLKPSPAFEDEAKRWIRQRNGKTFFAIPPENTQELLSAVRSGVADLNQGRLVITTSVEGIRPFVRRLIELEFPRIIVLSTEELSADRCDDVSGAIEYTKEAKAEPFVLGKTVEELKERQRAESTAPPAMPSRPERIEVILSPKYLKELLGMDPKASSISVRTPTLDRKIQDLFAMMGDGLFYELGIRVPEVFLTASTDVEENALVLRLNHLAGPAQKGLRVDQMLVNATAEQLRLKVPGIAVTEATNLANNAECGIIDQKDEQTVKEKLPGTYIWNPVGYIILALSQELRQNAWRLLDTEAVEYELAQLYAVFPELTLAVMENVSCEHLSRVLVQLLREEISIRDLRAILGRVLTYDYIVTDPSNYIVFDDRIAIHERLNLGRENDVENYVQYIRAGLKRPISHKYTRGCNTLVVYLLDPKIEERVIDELAFQGGDASSKPLKTEEREEILAAVRSEFDSLPATYAPPVILTTSSIRSFMRKLVAREFPALAVLAYEELSLDMNIQPIARISAANL